MPAAPVIASSNGEDEVLTIQGRFILESKFTCLE
jgi:hypothetical protein